MPATLIFLKKTIFLASLLSYKIILTEMYLTNVTPEVRVTNLYYYQVSISGKAGVMVNLKLRRHISCTCRENYIALLINIL
jgi:hypothetical protein